MGANAQTTVPTFVASQVLTADQQNQSARTGVPVFASTVTRDAAFGGTGEKTLAEGQLCYVEGTGLQTYNGSSWVTWGAAGSGLSVVKAETSFSAASSVTVDNIFSSTYTNYRLMVRLSTSAADCFLRLRVSGTSSSTGYNYQLLETQTTSNTAVRTSNAAQYFVTSNSNGAFFQSAVVELFSPNVAAVTNIMTLSSRSDGAYTATSNFTVFGNHNVATAYDGIELLPGSGTITGAYTVYGYAKS